MNFHTFAEAEKAIETLIPDQGFLAEVDTAWDPEKKRLLVDWVGPDCHVKLSYVFRIEGTETPLVEGYMAPSDGGELPVGVLILPESNVGTLTPQGKRKAQGKEPECVQVLCEVGIRVQWHYPLIPVTQQIEPVDPKDVRSDVVKRLRTYGYPTGP